MGVNSSFPESSQQVARAAFSRLAHAYTVSDTDINVREKKKKASKFATLRKKLTRARRHSRSLDYGKALRDLTASWSLAEVKALIQEYEALASLKELALAANLARPASSSFRQDLSNLFDKKFSSDVDLVYRGACFPAHRALLSMRSPYFRNLLSRYPDFNMQVPINFRTAGVDVTLFASLLRYLYTDSIKTEDLKHEHKKVLIKLVEEFGMPNPLEQDLRNLLDTGDYRDAVLVFSCDLVADMPDPMSASMTESYTSNDFPCKTTQHELYCHKAILAARSPFFRNLLLRRARSGEEITDRTLNTPTRIVLDESVIPRRYARVLLNAIYQDTVDLSLILRGSASMCSLSEAQAIVAGKGQMTIVDEAMEVYQIGQFLDFPILSQGCEDIIVEHISIDNLMNILSWSSEPHGSQWVHRQALHYLREEFLQVIHSPVLLDLSKEYLIEALSSDFLQAGELDVLTAVLKWGEHQLIRRIEEREPNLLSHTTHSISKKGVKKRDLNDIELRDILAELLPLIRVDHIIPYNSELLNSAIKRGLVSTPPSHMLGDEATGGQRVCAWIRSKHNGMYMRPRIFTPYFEEAKSMRDEFLSQGQDSDAGRVRTIQMSAIPDTLYMVDEAQYPQTPGLQGLTSSSTVDIIAGTIPVPDSNTLKLMLQREAELQSSKLCQRAYSLPFSDRRAINCQLQLRTVREFGMPDITIEILQNSQIYYSNNESLPASLQLKHGRRYHSSPVRQKPSPPLSRHSSKLGSPTKPVVPVTPTRIQPSRSKETNTSPCSDSALSDIMPDIAMATSSMGQVRVHEEFELDIGDGNSHHGTMYI
ncbi:LOW QUALITY PROTEIN: BTB/POZ domain-containing protein 7-like [Pecten maximus]|uniref:LOW QUALITY PROTEIN: BTB/POZ domain-containing protein 7-like n=2 Tax=Pecten maximus TaxID=6579 RepID=UPI001458CFEF|nr:LOW QUALITY PROTEIN: BTB/POZ domain-containing protein 7-like [Pecten maximus]